MEVLAVDEPVLRTTLTGPLAELIPMPTHEYPMVAVAACSSCRRSRTWTPVTFYELPTGERTCTSGCAPRLD